MYSALRAEFPFYPSKPRGDRIFTPIFKLGDRIFPGQIFSKVNFPGHNSPPPVKNILPININVHQFVVY